MEFTKIKLPITSKEATIALLVCWIFCTGARCGGWSLGRSVKENMPCSIFQWIRCVRVESQKVESLARSSHKEFACALSAWAGTKCIKLLKELSPNFKNYFHIRTHTKMWNKRSSPERPRRRSFESLKRTKSALRMQAASKKRNAPLLDRCPYVSPSRPHWFEFLVARFVSWRDTQSYKVLISKNISCNANASAISTNTSIGTFCRVLII